MKLRTVFMGTPDFSSVIASALEENGFDVVAVVTQPDKEAGRGKKLRPSPVKEWALQRGIDVYQPEKVRNEDFVEILRNIAPDLIVTAAFGQIVPKSILDMPEYGCVNVHASILPKYRGASPIQQSLFDGEKVTGITLQYMDEKIDDGDVILINTLQINDDDNCGTLFDRLADLGAKSIADYAEMLKNGKPIGTPQDHSLATYCTKIGKDQGNIDWCMPAQSIVNTVRAMSPSPGAYTYLNGKRIKIITAKVRPCEHNKAFGALIFDKNSLSVACADGFVDIIQLQPEGKSVQQVKDFLNGNKLQPDMVFERNID